jgi:hypothetical protein
MIYFSKIGVIMQIKTLKEVKAICDLIPLQAFNFFIEKHTRF